MIINCICGKKNFRVPDEQMPREGRKLQCGSCSQVWFYQPHIEEVESLETKNQSPQISTSTLNIQVEKKAETTKEVNIKNKPPLILDPKTIIQPTGIKIAKEEFSLNGIYILILFIFSLSIFLASIRAKVILVFPFLKTYLNFISFLVDKVFKALGLF